MDQLSNPSLLINGDFQIAQRGTNFDITHNRIYTLDRWVAGSDDGKVRVTNLSNGGMQIETLEAGNIVVAQHWLTSELDLRGKTITASISIDTSKPLMLHIYAKKSIGDWSDIVYKTISQNGIVSVTGTIPNDCERFNIEVNGTGFAPGDIEKFNWAKLELGTVATPFVPRPYGEELTLCQRYYQILPTGFAYPSCFYTRDTMDFLIPLSFPMRVKPTATISGGQIRVLNSDTGVATTNVFSNPVVAAISDSSINFRLTKENHQIKQGSFWVDEGGICILDSEIY